MGKRAFNQVSWTPTAQADGSSAITGSFMAINGASATQIVQTIELYLGGQAGASAVNAMSLVHSSTLGITPTALSAATASDGVMNSSGVGVTATSYIAAATAPVRNGAATLARLLLTFNAFGGIVRWVAAPGEEWTTVGNATTSASESLLSAQNVGTPGLMSGHWIYEVL